MADVIFSNEEYEDMHFIYSECQGSTLHLNIVTYSFNTNTKQSLILLT